VLSDLAVAGSTLLFETQLDGSWRSTDDGDHWTLLPDVRSFAVAPSDPSVIYADAATGRARSSDGGASWAQYNSRMSVESVSAEPTRVYGVVEELDGDIVFDRVARSDDAGLSPQVFDVPLVSVFRMHADARDPDRVYVQGDSSWFTSGNAGATWQAIEGNLRNLRTDPTTAGRVWALAGDELLRSDDAGTAWTVMTGGPTTLAGFVVDASGRALVFSGTDLWTVTEPDHWSRVATMPVAPNVGESGECADHLVIVGPLGLHVTYSLGQ
jgi:hypothetical protein